MIIGITGRKTAGKDTAAQYLIDKYDFTRIGYADVLKEAVANLFDITAEDVDRLKNEVDGWGWRVEIVSHRQQSVYKQFTWRQFLQRFGTEMGRNTFGPSFWVNQLMARLESNKNYVIPDVRFDNETIPCSIIIEIVRPDLPVDRHASEQGLRDELIDFIIPNTGTIEDLHSKVEKCLTDVLLSDNLSS